VTMTTKWRQGQWRRFISGLSQPWMKMMDNYYETTRWTRRWWTMATIDDDNDDDWRWRWWTIEQWMQFIRQGFNNQY
jgi:hypothetical protein